MILCISKHKQLFYSGSRRGIQTGLEQQRVDKDDYKIPKSLRCFPPDIFKMLVQRITTVMMIDKLETESAVVRPL